MVHIVCTGRWPPYIQVQTMSVHTDESYYANIRVCSLITACYTGEWLSDSKVHGANMAPIWGRQDPGGPHVGPMNFVIWAAFCLSSRCYKLLYNCEFVDIIYKLFLGMKDLAYILWNDLLKDEIT